MLINTFLDTEDFVHLYYPEDEPDAAQGCGAGARMASKYPARPPSPEYSQVEIPSTSEMSDRERYRTPPQPEPPPHRVRAADLYPRLRTHYDEAGLDAGFIPICGEFIQWVGRTADGGTISMSNYRLHVQPRRRSDPGTSIPLRLIDSLEMRDLLHLIVLCKNGRQLKCSFNTGDACAEWSRRLNMAIAPLGSIQETFAAAYAAWAKEQPPTSVHRALIRASQSAQRHWFGPEVERLGFTSRGAWRVTAANAEYKLCPSYPPLLVVPESISDEDLSAVARFRAMRRLPAVVWRHSTSGAVIARSSQPEVGWLGWRSGEDERLLAAFVNACNADRQGNNNINNKQLKLLIVDARSYASAVTNRARGGGCECQQYYPAADIQFMSLPNIHHVRRSFQQMRALAAEPNDTANWHSNLERTLWPQYVSGVARAASVVARAVASGRPVLVHCSDGWDRTPQIVATAQIILDPYYRTIEGFRIIIEREWLDFGHKFADRCGHQFGPEDPNERSPIFLQWLDVIHQMMIQFPCSFEFNEAYLIKLGTHVHSCMFGTFMCNSGKERVECRANDLTPQVWHLVRAPAYRNHLYSPHHIEQTIWPDYSLRSMVVWNAMFGAYNDARHETRERQSRLNPPTPLITQHHGLMTKTRSCDNLLNDAEKPPAQRRSSDPNIAPDVMKLSLVVPSDSDNVGGSTLTDSCVDELPVLPITEDNTQQEEQAQDQVDGLDPDHFESGVAVRDVIASGSSSLERELGGAADVSDDVTTHDDVTAAHTPDDTAVFDTYTDVIGIQEAARESARTRNISITWRSVSESSNQSSTGFEVHEGRGDPPSHESSPLDNHNSTEGDKANHNVEPVASTSHDVVSNMNGADDVAAKFLEVNLNSGATSSSISSESEGEVQTAPRRSTHGRARVASQLTLCPTSPRRVVCCHCSRRTSTTSGVETSGSSSGECWCGVCGRELSDSAERVRCVCGAGAARHAAPLDGLAPAPDPLQARLHQIILYQKKVVEELSSQLREARERLRLSSPVAQLVPPSNNEPPVNSPQIQAAAVAVSGGGGGGGGSGSSSSGSLSEVEVGEEARGVVWVRDSDASSCQHCNNHFWLARRRHHCRNCGGIFCGSCAQMSDWGDYGTMRVCRGCRAAR